MGEDDDTYVFVDMPPNQRFEMAVIKAMLQFRRLLVRRDEVWKYLPEGFDNDPLFVNTKPYVLVCNYEYDGADILSLPAILQMFTDDEKEIFGFMVASKKLSLTLDDLDEVMREYYEFLTDESGDRLMEIFIDEAGKYFLVEELHVGKDRNAITFNIYENTELLATIKYDASRQAYVFERGAKGAA